ncbi:MAG: hypothetical protein JKY90_08115, partial [Gammaproteobacteria bacterium]|nr:hypothetical protein [Gammaproteobacteria bacterium]
MSLFRLANVIRWLLVSVSVFGFAACGGGGGGSGGDNNEVIDTFTISGNLTGLSDSSIVLQQNGADDLTLTANGSFAFVSAINDASTYSVSVLTQPGAPSQTCSVNNGSGVVAGSNINTVT